MDRFSVRGLLSLVGFAVGLPPIALSIWVLASFPAEPASGGDGFGAGLAFLGTMLVGILGIAVVGAALVISPASGEGGGVLTVGRRQRQLAGLGITTLGASVIAPFGVGAVFDLPSALVSWYWLTVAGVLVVAAAFVWTSGEAALARLGVLG